MKIRKVEQSDFTEWLRLRKLLYSEYESKELMREIEAIYFDKSVVGELDYFVCVVESTESKLCGFCEISLRKTDPYSQDGPVGYVESLFVDPGFRRKGLARGMLAEGEKWVRSNNCSEFWVDTDEGYYEALHCYKRFGFNVVNKNKPEIILNKKLH